MAASVLQSAEVRKFGRLWWLPTGGQGNGLDDAAWAPALELSEEAVPAVLAELRTAMVPGYAGPVPGRRGGWRLWVGASAYGRAEAVLLAVMPRVVRERQAHGDQAWR